MKLNRAKNFLKKENYAEEPKFFEVRQFFMKKRISKKKL